MNNPLLLLHERLHQEFPALLLNLDEPETDTGHWWLDVTADIGPIAVEYRPGAGFGLHVGEEKGYGSRPDEFYGDEEVLWNRIRQLLMDRVRRLSIRDLRDLLEVTQTELSERLGQGQASVSRLENRSDVLLTSLNRVVEALGGRLEIRAHFDTCDVPLFIGDDAAFPDTASPDGGRLPLVDQRLEVGDTRMPREEAA